MVPSKFVAAAVAAVTACGLAFAQGPAPEGDAPSPQQPPSAAPGPAAPGERPAPPPVPPYGAPINFETAKRAMAAAEAEASKLNAAVVIAIMDTGGRMVVLHRLDGVQHASLRLAEGKARTALEFGRPTRVLEDAVARGGAGLRFLALDDLTPLEGGLPIIVDGKIVGAVGVSGASAAHNSQIARAAADAVK